MPGNFEEEKVRVRFITQVEKFRVTETPFLIPVALGRQGLSEVISHLLNGEVSSKKSESKMLFDFMVQGILIRTPLSKLLSRFQYKGTISSEDILTIEYFPATAIDKNNPKDPIEIPAWVGCITTAQIRNSGDPRDFADLAIAGCYDGHVQVINVGHMLGEKLSLSESDGSGSNRLDFEAHSEPVRAVCSWVPATTSQSFAVQESVGSGRGRKKTPQAAASTILSSASVTVCIATGSKDHSVKLWRGLYSPSALSFQPPQLVATLPGSSSVESLAMVNMSQQQRVMLFCGDWSGCLRGWKLPVDLNLEDHSSILDDEAVGDGQQKRRKTGSSEAQSSSLPKESFCIKAHTQTLAGVDADAVGEAGQQLLWTCSWDRSLKLWDIERQDCVACFVCPKVATSVQRRGSAVVGDGAGSSREVIATSHTDGKVRLWDSRIGGAAAEDRSVPVSTFGRDTQWISQVRWRPGSEFLFAASDYSGAVSLWDTRATTSPLSSAPAHEGKALCLDWISASSSRNSSSFNNSNSDSSGGSSSAAVEGNRRQRRSETAKEVPPSSTMTSQWAILSGGSDSKLAISPINSF